MIRSLLGEFFKVTDNCHWWFGTTAYERNTHVQHGTTRKRKPGTQAGIESRDLKPSRKSEAIDPLPTE